MNKSVEKPKDVSAERNTAMLWLYIVMWFLTLAGFVLWLLGEIPMPRWSVVVSPLSVIILIVLTTGCVKTKKDKNYRNVHIGICCQFLSLLLLLIAYKIFYRQLEISVWYLILTIIIGALVGALWLWNFKKQGMTTKLNNSRKNAIIGALTFGLVGIAERLVSRTSNLGFEQTSHIVTATSVALLALLLMSSSVRYFVISDDRLLYEKCSTSGKNIRRWF